MPDTIEDARARMRPTYLAPTPDPSTYLVRRGGETLGTLAQNGRVWTLAMPGRTLGFTSLEAALRALCAQTGADDATP